MDQTMFSQLKLLLISIGASLVALWQWRKSAIDKAKNEAYIAEQETKIKSFLAQKKKSDEKVENAIKVSADNAASDDGGVIARLRDKWSRD